MLADFEHDPLYRRSVEIILTHQAASGGYIACPNFPTYHYCWFRDSAFTAYAMGLAGEHASASRFHDWAARQINHREQIVERAIAKSQAGEPLTSADYLHTRYTLDGQEEGEVEEAWPNFQLDGFGTWLWAIYQHSRFVPGPLPQSWLQAASLTARYLSALWSQPCYDCWEEFPRDVHPHTLAAIYGGLQAHQQLTGADHERVLGDIRASLLERFVYNGHFVKFPGQTAVDASLLGLAVPYGVVSPDDPLMLGAVMEIEATLRRGGGVHRYATDTYYGGGEWILLTAWLGWYTTHLPGEQARSRAVQALEWVRSQAREDGALPEQVSVSLNDPGWQKPWLEKWGPPASPLLWSHAKYIILVEALKGNPDMGL
jgi:GH15 family glucan-1,4-alpha-glucosidase